MKQHTQLTVTICWRKLVPPFPKTCLTRWRSLHLLLMAKNPKAAVYAALRMAEINKDVLLSQNNLAVVLHQTGYPQYALPLLEYYPKIKTGFKRQKDKSTTRNNEQLRDSLTTDKSRIDNLFK